VRRGELVTSLADIAEACEWYENRKVRRWSRQQVSRLLATLCDIGFISVNSDRSVTHVTVCHYDRYHSPDGHNSDSAGTVATENEPKSHNSDSNGTPLTACNAGSSLVAQQHNSDSNGTVADKNTGKSHNSDSNGTALIPCADGSCRTSEGHNSDSAGTVAAEADGEGGQRGEGKESPDLNKKENPEKKEKRREEREEEENTICPEIENPPPVIEIPLIPRDGIYPVTAEQVAEWQEAYPGIDVMQELRHARQWCLADTRRCKTARGVTRFLVGWLGRAQDRGGRVWNAGQPALALSRLDAERKTKDYSL
jgi:hypothetical protein